MDAFSQRFDVRPIDVGDAHVDLDRRVDRTQSLRSGDRFGRRFARIEFIEQHLSLEVRPLDQVTIDDSKKTNARSRELISDNRSQRAATDQQHARLRKSVLTLGTDLRKQFLTVVSVHALATLRGSVYSSPCLTMEGDSHGR
jgi:hypothetical protein